MPKKPTDEVIEDSQLAQWWFDTYLAGPSGGVEGRRQDYQRRLERDRRLKLFLDRHNLKESKSHPTIAKVAGKRLARQSFGDHYYYHLGDEKSAYPEAIGWFDHNDIFYSSEHGYVVTTQPYGLTQEKVSALEALCFELGITVTVLPSDGWHYAGCCPLVVVHKTRLLIKGEAS